MQKSDKEFEQYLQQFRPQPPPRLPESRNLVNRWLLSAAALVVVGILVGLWSALEHKGIKQVSSAAGEKVPPVNVGKWNELMRRNPENFETQMTVASSGLLPEVTSPEGALRLLSKE